MEAVGVRVRITGIEPCEEFRERRRSQRDVRIEAVHVRPRRKKDASRQPDLLIF